MLPGYGPDPLARYAPAHREVIRTQARDLARLMAAALPPTARGGRSGRAVGGRLLRRHPRAVRPSGRPREQTAKRGGWTVSQFPIPPPGAPQLAPGPSGGQLGPPPQLPTTPQGMPTLPPGMLPPGSLPPGMPPGVGSPGMGPPGMPGIAPPPGALPPGTGMGGPQGQPGDDLADIHEPDFDPTDLGPRPPPPRRGSLESIADELAEWVEGMSASIAGSLLDDQGRPPFGAPVTGQERLRVLRAPVLPARWAPQPGGPAAGGPAPGRGGLPADARAGQPGPPAGAGGSPGGGRGQRRRGAAGAADAQRVGGAPGAPAGGAHHGTDRAVRGGALWLRRSGAWRPSISGTARRRPTTRTGPWSSGTSPRESRPAAGARSLIRSALRAPWAGPRRRRRPRPPRCSPRTPPPARWGPDAPGRTSTTG